MRKKYFATFTVIMILLQFTTVAMGEEMVPDEEIQRIFVSPDPSANFTEICNPTWYSYTEEGEELDETTKSDRIRNSSNHASWEAFKTDVGVDGVWTGRLCNESLVDVSNRLETDIDAWTTSIQSFTPQQVMSGVSEGWVRSPFQLDSEDEGSMQFDIYAIDNDYDISLEDEIETMLKDVDLHPLFYDGRYDPWLNAFEFNDFNNVETKFDYAYNKAMWTHKRADISDLTVTMRDNLNEEQLGMSWFITNDGVNWGILRGEIQEDILGASLDPNRGRMVVLEAPDASGDDTLVDYILNLNAYHPVDDDQFSLMTMVPDHKDVWLAVNLNFSTFDPWTGNKDMYGEACVNIHTSNSPSLPSGLPPTDLCPYTITQSALMSGNLILEPTLSIGHDPFTGVIGDIIDLNNVYASVQSIAGNNITTLPNSGTSVDLIIQIIAQNTGTGSDSYVWVDNLAYYNKQWNSKSGSSGTEPGLKYDTSELPTIEFNQNVQERAIYRGSLNPYAFTGDVFARETIFYNDMFPQDQNLVNGDTRDLFDSPANHFKLQFTLSSGHVWLNDLDFTYYSHATKEPHYLSHPKKVFTSFVRIEDWVEGGYQEEFYIVDDRSYHRFIAPLFPRGRENPDANNYLFVFNYKLDRSDVNYDISTKIYVAPYYNEEGDNAHTYLDINAVEYDLRGDMGLGISALMIKGMGYGARGFQVHLNDGEYIAFTHKYQGDAVVMEGSYLNFATTFYDIPNEELDISVMIENEDKSWNSGWVSTVLHQYLILPIRYYSVLDDLPPSNLFTIKIKYDRDDNDVPAQPTTLDFKMWGIQENNPEYSLDMWFIEGAQHPEDNQDGYWGRVYFWPWHSLLASDGQWGEMGIWEPVTVFETNVPQFFHTKISPSDSKIDVIGWVVDGFEAVGNAAYHAVFDTLQEFGDHAWKEDCGYDPICWAAYPVVAPLRLFFSTTKIGLEALADGVFWLGEQADKIANMFFSAIEWAWSGLAYIANEIWEFLEYVGSQLWMFITALIPLAMALFEFIFDLLTFIIQIAVFVYILTVWDKLLLFMGNLFDSENSSYHAEQFFQTLWKPVQAGISIGTAVASGGATAALSGVRRAKSFHKGRAGRITARSKKKVGKLQAQTKKTQNHIDKQKLKFAIRQSRIKSQLDKKNRRQ